MDKSKNLHDKRSRRKHKKELKRRRKRMAKKAKNSKHKDRGEVKSSKVGIAHSVGVDGSDNEDGFNRNVWGLADET